MSEWDEIRDRMLAIAEEWDAVCLDAAHLVREVQVETDIDRKRFDPRRSLAEAARFLTTVGFAGEELRQKANRIEPRPPTTQEVTDGSG